jgi:hypothetical protein
MKLNFKVKSFACYLQIASVQTQLEMIRRQQQRSGKSDSKNNI